jgi:hypothetical protein
MRRIAIWMTATAVVLGSVIGFQITAAVPSDQGRGGAVAPGEAHMAPDAVSGGGDEAATRGEGR